MSEEKKYKELNIGDFSEEILELHIQTQVYPQDPMNYYYLAKEYMLKVPIRAISSLKYIEDLLKKSLELAPELWAPKIFLGELLFKQGKFSEAEPYFKEVIKEKPESVSIKEYLAECIENKDEKYSESDLLYLFENSLRKFIKRILEKKLKENWWRQGVPTKTRVSCVSRREIGIAEEMDRDLILFADFYDYKEIIKHNKGIFGQYLNVKEWCSKLNEIEPIRNIIAHNRDLDNAFEKIKSCYDDLNRVIKNENK